MHTEWNSLCIYEYMSFTIWVELLKLLNFSTTIEFIEMHLYIKVFILQHFVNECYSIL